MKQLVHNLADGVPRIVQAPAPIRRSGHVLVATRASVISAGTERATLAAGAASLLGKAQQRPDKVRQVLDMLEREGPIETWHKVQQKLHDPQTLGYSCAGVVLEADPGEDLHAGMRVACAGVGFASHAELVSVPHNLVTPLPDSVDFARGSLTTLGAIALQGVRRAAVGLGDRVLVIGLGLIGQLTWKLVHAAGGLPIGADIDAGAVAAARAMGLEHAADMRVDDLEGLCSTLTESAGVDAIIITASAASAEPLEIAGRVARLHGRVVVVGMMPVSVPRELYYSKELDLAVSRSYGPGRYDPQYEDHGIDYPIGEVRWTEGRNMAAFAAMLGTGQVDVKALITHRFAFDDALDAYELLRDQHAQLRLAIVLEYGDQPDTRRTVALRPLAPVPGVIRVAALGAGSFAKARLLPWLKQCEEVELVAVATASGYTATEVGRAFDAVAASTDLAGLASSEDVDAVVIATRHDLHADLCCRALQAAKHVYVEKPLAMTPQQLTRVADAARDSGSVLQVGFNRRFSPFALALREVLSSSGAPAQIVYRVNAGVLPETHWLLDAQEGGGRIIGEACHFIDLIAFLSEEHVTHVSATQIGDDATGATSMLLELSGGSSAVLVYQANAPPRLRKERIEAFAHGRGGVIDDWHLLETMDGHNRNTRRVFGQAKGFSEQLQAFVGAIHSGEAPIPLESLINTTLTTFAVRRSLSERCRVAIEPDAAS